MSADRGPGGAHSLGQAEEQRRIEERTGGDSAGPLGQAVQEVTEKAQVLVKDEIALAKAEVTGKAKKLGKGAAVGAAAGVFALGGLLMLLHTLAWFFAWLFGISTEVFLGFLVVTVLMFVLAAIAGLVAKKLISRGSPPTPDMAIEEAKRIRETVQSS